MASGSGSGSGSGEGRSSRSRRRNPFTWVYPEDPNRRSTIQQHTAHHSNRQRREARLEILRRSRRGLLAWTRRDSADVSVTSASSSASSSSISPLPLTQSSNPAVDDTTTVAVTAGESSGRASPDRETAIRYLVDTLCQHCPDRAACEEIVTFAQADEACTYLLLAYSISLRLHHGDSIDNEADSNAARNYLNRGTSLLRTRLSDQSTASADANIQAVLLLIAYTADYSTFEAVRIHANALRTMIDQRGRVEPENYPAILVLQLRSIGMSRFFHLTLDCADPCEAPIRFPRGLFSV